mmetsp:Transcript_22749/g.52433  ORF Transcript_22749/g.52433 Transcript_22749/m.52433 type:complete len:101 (-) Transcript_22749:1089-1391(-)
MVVEVGWFGGGRGRWVGGGAIRRVDNKRSDGAQIRERSCTQQSLPTHTCASSHCQTAESASGLDAVQTLFPNRRSDGSRGAVGGRTGGIAPQATSRKLRK